MASLLYTISIYLCALINQVYLLVLKMLSHLLLLPWPNKADADQVFPPRSYHHFIHVLYIQHWEQRSTEHNKLVNAVCKNYTKTTQQVNFFTSKELQIKGTLVYPVRVLCTCVSTLATPLISEALLALEDLVSSVVHERAKSKAIMYKSISGIIDVTISLFSIYLNKLGTCCMQGF